MHEWSSYNNLLSNSKIFYLSPFLFFHLPYLQRPLFLLNMCTFYTLFCLSLILSLSLAPSLSFWTHMESMLAWQKHSSNSNSKENVSWVVHNSTEVTLRSSLIVCLAEVKNNSFLLEWTMLIGTIMYFVVKTFRKFCRWSNQVGP